MTIANLTLGNIRSDVRTRLNEAGLTSGVWVDSEINTRINRAVLRAQVDVEQDTVEATINLRQNVAWYALPSDCLVPLFIYGPSAWSFARLYPTQITKMDRLQTNMGSWETGAAQRTTLFIPFSYDKFILWPAPNVNTTVTLFYSPVPATLSADGDTTVFHLSVQELIPIYAAYLCMRKHDFSTALVFLREYKQRLAVVKADIGSTASVRPSRMAPAKPFDRAHATPELRMGGGRGRGYL